MDVLVAGGNGFIGRALCGVLADRGHGVTAASRSPDPATLPETVETATVDVTEPDLAETVAGHDAVVNLVALPSHREPRGRTHEAVHLGGTKHLVAACEEAGVDRFVQLSGLGVESGVETAYFDAKRRAEDVVRESALSWVIVRPSIVVGDGCAFLPFVESVVPPVVAPLPGGGHRPRLQPIWVGDLASMLADCVLAERHAGATYELGGPERLTFREVIEQVCQPRLVVPVPWPVARLGFRLAEALPVVPLGMDQYCAFALDNTVADNDVDAFGIVEGELRTLAECLGEGQA